MNSSMDLVKMTDVTDIDIGNIQPTGKNTSPGLKKTKTLKIGKRASNAPSLFKQNTLRKSGLAIVEGAPDLSGNTRKPVQRSPDRNPIKQDIDKMLDTISKKIEPQSPHKTASQIQLDLKN